MNPKGKKKSWQLNVLSFLNFQARCNFTFSLLVLLIKIDLSSSESGAESAGEGWKEEELQHRTKTYGS